VDEILVMDRGRVVERGTHDQLLAADGRYSDLWWDEMRIERHATSYEISLHYPPPERLASTRRGGSIDGSHLP
jgi:ABC-type glutathione transport system ATPase component